MPYFTSALQTVLDRSFSGKQTALAAACDMQQADISRLLREEAPLSSAKLAKLLNAEGMSEADQHLLSQSAVRDFVGEEAYRTWFTQPQPDHYLREDLGGHSFQSLFPLNPRAAQVIAYIVAHAHEPDTAQALELLGKFLELPTELEVTKDEYDLLAKAGLIATGTPADKPHKPAPRRTP
ncbi:MAG: hypothetical protein EBR88_03960 [Betaproteobacteria bacterium]|nr:hypothetical protein [Betaproteobacteria bacterium]